MTQLPKKLTSLAWGMAVVASGALALAQRSAPLPPPNRAMTAPAPQAAPAPQPTPTIAHQVAPSPAQSPPMHTMSGHDGPAFTALPADQRTSAVNAARAKYNLGVISQAAAVALQGGVLLTPAAPVSGKSYLSLDWEVLMTETRGGRAITTRTAYLLQPVPTDAHDAFNRGYITAEFETEANRLYVADCSLSSAQALTVSFVVRHGHPANNLSSVPKDDPVVMSVDQKANRAFLAFRAKGPITQVLISTYQTTYVPNAVSWIGDNNYVAFMGCSLLPAQ